MDNCKVQLFSTLLNSINFRCTVQIYIGQQLHNKTNEQHNCINAYIL